MWASGGFHRGVVIFEPCRICGVHSDRSSDGIESRRGECRRDKGLGERLFRRSDLIFDVEDERVSLGERLVQESAARSWHDVARSAWPRLR
jgi:hypothetical protein